MRGQIRSGGASIPLNENGTAGVIESPSDYSGVTAGIEVSDQSTTGVNSDISSASARVVRIAYIDNGAAAATGDLMYVSFNIDGTSAIGKLADAATRSVVLLGEERTFTFAEGAECTDIAYKSGTAETGNSLLAIEYVS